MYFESHTSHQSFMQHTTRDVVIALAVVVSLILLLNMCDHIVSNRTTDLQQKVVEKTIILPPDTVFVDKVQARIVYRKLTVHDTVNNTVYEVDTLLQTQPFVAFMDTTVGCKTLKIEFHYPENKFRNLNFVTCPDTLIVRDTVTTISNEPTLTKAIEYIGIGFFGGFVTGAAVIR